MNKFLMKLWKEEEGAETAEWLVIVALIVAVAILVYNGVLKTALTGLVAKIGGAIDAIVM
jgi:Flp pilus assembly pilin Flp